MNLSFVGVGLYHFAEMALMFLLAIYFIRKGLL